MLSIRHPARQWLVVLAAAHALAGLVGCGPRLYPVEGKVVWMDERPAKELVGGAVVFETQDTSQSARGEIEADGSFRLKTPTLGDGALPGKYRVLIIEALPDASDRVPPPTMNPKHQSFDTSRLEVTVEPKKNEPVLKVERAVRKAKR